MPGSSGGSVGIGSNSDRAVSRRSSCASAGPQITATAAAGTKGLPFFIVTHRPEEQPSGDAFVFVAGVEEAVSRANEAAGGKDVHVMGGADTIRQALEADLVDELTIIIAPVILGGGKRLFEGFTKDVELEHLGVRQSPFATFIDYRVR